MRYKPLTKAELARQLGVSRTHITLLAQGKRKLSERLADKLADVLAGKPNALSKASNPLGGMNSVLGGFDSHAPPPSKSKNSALTTAGLLNFILDSAINKAH
jgi:transcriptional regulator with XRE-family HTH domain